MADSPLKKRKKDAPEPFSWVPRPTNAVRGRANPGLTARTAPAAPVGPQPGRDGWFQPMGRADISRITSKYGTGQQPIVTAPANPLLGPGGPTVSSVGGPIVSPVATPNPALGTWPTEHTTPPVNPANRTPVTGPESDASGTGIEGEPDQFEDSRTPGVQRGPNGEIIIPPAAGGYLPAESSTQTPGLGLVPFTNSGTTNPLTGAPAPALPDQSEGDDYETALHDWLRKGGSVATFHNSLREKGRIPGIDARATQSDRNSTASDDIARARGWGKDADKDARGISDQMTGEFNQNNETAQRAWNDKFSAAHDALMKRLNNNP